LEFGNVRRFIHMEFGKVKTFIYMEFREANRRLVWESVRRRRYICTEIGMVSSSMI